MSRYIGRPYQGVQDLPLLIEFAQHVTSARLPSATYYHPGDFVWQLYAFESSDDVRLWSADADASIAACAIFEAPLTFQFAVDPKISDEEALTAEIVAWAEERRALVADKEEIPRAYQGIGSRSLATFVFDSDDGRIAMLVAHGFTEAQPSGVRFVRDLQAPLPPVDLPAGARFRAITDADADARAELHRDAWSVWGPSQHSVERYRQLRAAPLYDPDLDIVLEHEGRLVSYCVCWLDTANRAGYFEPVGTRPSAGRHGFGRAVMREGLRRLCQKGMTSAHVGTAIVNEPAMALYASAGFAVVEREHFYVKRDADAEVVERTA